VLTKDVRPRIAIPCHFWMLAEQGGGDPIGFVNACRSCCPDVRALLLKPGEGLTVTPADIAPSP
jgi:hypothetical protein